MTYQEAFDQSCKLRDDFWRQYGQLDTNVISFLVNPGFMGGPMWPSTRQAFKVLHRKTGTLLASDGLSDPFWDMETNPSNAPYNGYGLELYMQTTDQLTAEKPQNWQTNLIIQMSQQAAHLGNITAYVNRYRYISFELDNPGLPDEWLADGKAGIFIGLEDPEIDSEVTLALEKIKLVNIKLLTPAELQYAIAHDAEGRAKLAELFKAETNPTFSSLNRKSVI